MATKGKYDDHINKIIKMKEAGDTYIEIANQLNVLYDIGATADGVRGFWRRKIENQGLTPEKSTKEKAQDNSLEDTPAADEAHADHPAVKTEEIKKSNPAVNTPVAEDLKHLPALLEELEKQKTESVYQGKLLKNLEFLENKFNFVIEEITDFKEQLASQRAEKNKIIGACWFISLMLAVLVGYYFSFLIFQFYTKCYILAFLGIPAGWLLGSAYGAAIRAYKNKKRKKKK
jgi:hypothetical protein